MISIRWTKHRHARLCKAGSGDVQIHQVYKYPIFYKIYSFMKWHWIKIFFQSLPHPTHPVAILRRHLLPLSKFQILLAFSSASLTPTPRANSRVTLASDGIMVWHKGGPYIIQSTLPYMNPQRISLPPRFLHGSFLLKKIFLVLMFF